LEVDVVLPNGDEYRRCRVLAFDAALELATAVGDLHSIDPGRVVAARLVDHRP
jgi:hypothetical protein